MATSTIPMPATGQQPSPIVKAGGGPTAAGTIPGAPTSAPAQNPYIPPVGTAAPGSTGINSTGGAQVPQGSDPNQSLLQKQETDMYGKGVGGELTSLLGSISGEDSAALQNYVASLQPQKAVAQATTNATLGAQGVSGNSSVAAIADANLNAQETAAIAGESAQLQTHEQDLEAGILTGQQKDAASEVSASGWSVFGDVLGAIGQDAATAAGAIAKVATF